MATGRLPVPFSLDNQAVAALIVGGAAAAAIGAIDDLLDRPRAMAVSSANRARCLRRRPRHLDRLHRQPAGGAVIRFDGAIAAAFTIFWIVGMINSINFIDGLDGLSSGIAFIAARDPGPHQPHERVGQPLVAVLCCTLAVRFSGSCAGTSTPPRSSSDQRVQFVGYTLALLSILGTAKVAVALLVLACRSSTRSGSSSGASRSVGRRSARTAATSITGSSTSAVASTDGVRHLRDLPRPRGHGLVPLGRRPALRVRRRVHRVRARLFIPTRGALRRPEELEADSNEPDMARRGRHRAPATRHRHRATRLPAPPRPRRRWRHRHPRPSPSAPAPKAVPVAPSTTPATVGVTVPGASRRPRRTAIGARRPASADSTHHDPSGGAVRCGNGSVASQRGSASIPLPYHWSGLPWYYQRSN